MEVKTSQLWQLIDQMWALTQHVRRGQRENANDPLTAKLLSLAAERDDLRPQDVVNQLELTPPSVTRHIKALEKEGHITLIEDPADGRTYLIRLTGPGAAMLASLRDQIVDRIRPALADWDGADIDRLVELFGRLNASMDAQIAARPDRPLKKNRWRQ